MALAYVFDENMPGRLYRAVQRHNRRGLHLLDVVRVGDLPDLPRGSDDPSILIWAERERRILVTLDVTTMPGHLAAHLAAGHHAPGVFTIRPKARMDDVVEYLAIIAHASDVQDWQDGSWYIP
jgi:hypothetical protein